jgi:hypothetical protein
VGELGNFSKPLLFQRGKTSVQLKYLSSAYHRQTLVNRQGLDLTHASQRLSRMNLQGKVEG